MRAHHQDGVGPRVSLVEFPERRRAVGQGRAVAGLEVGDPGAVPVQGVGADLDVAEILVPVCPVAEGQPIGTRATRVSTRVPRLAARRAPQREDHLRSAALSVHGHRLVELHRHDDVAPRRIPAGGALVGGDLHVDNPRHRHGRRGGAHDRCRTRPLLADGEDAIEKGGIRAQPHGVDEGGGAPVNRGQHGPVGAAVIRKLNAVTGDLRQVGGRGRLPRQDDSCRPLRNGGRVARRSFGALHGTQDSRPTGGCRRLGNGWRSCREGRRQDDQPCADAPYGLQGVDSRPGERVG